MSGKTPAPSQAITALEALRQKINSATFDPDKPEEPQQVVFRIDGIPVGNLQNFSAIIGRPGAGKSRLVSAIEGSALAGYDVWGMKVTFPDERRMILHFDTEQSEYSHRKCLRNVSNYAHLEGMPRHIKSFLFREYSPREIMEMIEQAIIDNPQAAIVIIDGYLDLLRDFNNVAESGAVVDWLKRITKQYNIYIIGIVHQSKRDQFSIGHLGSMVERYAQSAMTVEKDKTGKVYTVTAIKVRDEPYFDPFEIQEINGVFDRTTQSIKSVPNVPVEKKKPEELPENDHIYYMNMVFDEDGIDYDSLVQDIMETQAMSNANARRYVSYWQKMKWVYTKGSAKNENKLYYRKISAKMRLLKTT